MLLVGYQPIPYLEKDIGNLQRRIFRVCPYYKGEDK
jgi:hypothetical protein